MATSSRSLVASHGLRPPARIPPRAIAFQIGVRRKETSRSVAGAAVIVQSYARGGASRVTVIVPSSTTAAGRGPPLILRSNAMLTPRALAVCRAGATIVGIDCPSTGRASSGPIAHGSPAPRAMSRPCTRLSLGIRPVTAANVIVARCPYRGTVTGVSGARPSVIRRNVSPRSATKSPGRACPSPPRRSTDLASMAAIRSVNGASPGGRTGVPLHGPDGGDDGAVREIHGREMGTDVAQRPHRNTGTPEDASGSGTSPSSRTRRGRRHAARRGSSRAR